jgi:hypothetical protein
VKTVTAAGPPAYYPETFGNPGQSVTIAPLGPPYSEPSPARRWRSATAALLVVFAGFAPGSVAQPPSEPNPLLVLAAGPASPPKSADALSPEEKMQRRYPQAVRVGDLIGLPLLDDQDRPLGRVKSVVRTAGDKIQLIVPYGGFLGWRQRLVAVPIEVVAIAGRQLAALDMTRAEFRAAPAWNDPQSRPLSASETIRVGLYRR